MTVREERKVKPKTGEVLHMYTGLRTKQCSKITSDHCLNGTQSVNIIIIEYEKTGNHKLEINVDGRNLDGAEQNDFIRLDGFDTILDFIDYWKKSTNGHKLYHGKTHYIIGNRVIYHWTNLRF